jgi:NADH-quinone oxidoreductase subunit L
MIHYLILIVLALPLMGWLVMCCVSARNEALLSKLAVTAAALQTLVALYTWVYWTAHGHEPFAQKELVLYASHDYEFFLAFYFDHISATFLITGSLLTWLVCAYSRVYMHREKGYKRFFQTILFFSIGYSLTVLSGNLETLFIGWEILGLSSFLLIAYYRDRYLPVKNAVKVFSIYRIGDLGILMAMWLSHHFWGGNVTFSELRLMPDVQEHIGHYSLVAGSIGMMLLLTAFAKSAAFPFSFWLPRAMEGPTPSSAIFYGSLSVHLGVFLLLRTHDLWTHLPSVKMVMIIVGALTLGVGWATSRVQSSIKSHIAYASIAQIGIMLIELGAECLTLVLIHFVGNALLRTYQLLISPSVASYKIKEQTYLLYPTPQKDAIKFGSRWMHTWYLLSLKEWDMDTVMYRYFWNPLKTLGAALGVITVARSIALFFMLLTAGILLLFTNYQLPHSVHVVFPFLFAVIGVGLGLKSFTERHNPFAALLLVAMNHCMLAIAVAFNEHYDYLEALTYLSGILLAAVAGYIVLWRFKKREGHLDMNQFHGHSYKHPKTAFLFLLVCLGLSGFPITPTFIGEDLIFGHIHEKQIGLAFLAALSFVLDGLATMRIYARLFLGPHSQSIHEMGYRSS